MAKLLESAFSDLTKALESLNIVDPSIIEHQRIATWRFVFDGKTNAKVIAKIEVVSGLMVLTLQADITRDISAETANELNCCQIVSNWTRRVDDDEDKSKSTAVLKCSFCVPSQTFDVILSSLLGSMAMAVANSAAPKNAIASRDTSSHLSTIVWKAVCDVLKCIDTGTHTVTAAVDIVDSKTPGTLSVTQYSSVCWQLVSDFGYGENKCSGVFLDFLSRVNHSLPVGRWQCANGRIQFVSTIMLTPNMFALLDQDQLAALVKERVAANVHVHRAIASACWIPEIVAQVLLNREDFTAEQGAALVLYSLQTKLMSTSTDFIRTTFDAFAPLRTKCRITWCKKSRSGPQWTKFCASHLCLNADCCLRGCGYRLSPETQAYCGRCLPPYCAQCNVRRCVNIMNLGGDTESHLYCEGCQLKSCKGPECKSSPSRTLYKKQDICVECQCRASVPCLSIARFSDKMCQKHTKVRCLRKVPPSPPDLLVHCEARKRYQLQFDTCMNERSGPYYCTQHTCTVDSCPKARYGDSLLCYSHQPAPVE